MITDKNVMRELVRAQIGALGPDYIAGSDRGIFCNVASLPEFQNAETVMLYYSVSREPDTHSIAKTALNLGKRVCFPYCYRGGVMDARLVESLDELKPAMLDIPAPGITAMKLAPEELDLVIVPALTYDIYGYRLGYGGGYYDRYLAKIGAYKVGLCRESLVRGELFREPHDIPVDCLVTEKRAERVKILGK